MDIEQARFNMIEQQIRPADVLDPATLETLSMVRRERFVSPVLQALAFAEIELPVGCGQHMLSPQVEAKVLQALNLRRGDSVLEIGCGSGYMAALLAMRTGQVHSLEIESVLVGLARENLQRAGVDNVVVVEADGSGGWAEAAPYDVIVASGAVPEIPQAWLDQLKIGGRLFAFVGKGPVMEGRVVTRVSGTDCRSLNVFETTVTPLRLKGAKAPFVL